MKIRRVPFCLLMVSRRIMGPRRLGRGCGALIPIARWNDVPSLAAARVVQANWTSTVPRGVARTSRAMTGLKSRAMTGLKSRAMTGWRSESTGRLRYKTIHSRKVRKRAASVASSRTSHSHSTRTDQPASRNAPRFRSSRDTFRASLAAHQSARTFGNTALRHAGSGWRCQKQPRTSTILRLALSTMSGVPGRVAPVQPVPVAQSMQQPAHG